MVGYLSICSSYSDTVYHSHLSIVSVDNITDLSTPTWTEAVHLRSKELGQLYKKEDEMELLRIHWTFARSLAPKILHMQLMYTATRLSTLHALLELSN